MTNDLNQIADALHAPRENVAANWPKIRTCLESLGMGSENCFIAALATVRVECPPFKPIKEYGGTKHLNDLYDTRADLGNTPEIDGDGAKYGGRGFIQITGHDNYKVYGEKLGIDLLSDPDRALDPDVSASILAVYFKDHGCDKAADAGNWKLVRKKVNGGTNGLNEFLAYVKALQSLKG